jgi:hypothetical protein
MLMQWPDLSDLHRKAGGTLNSTERWLFALSELMRHLQAMARPLTEEEEALRDRCRAAGEILGTALQLDFHALQDKLREGAREKTGKEGR